MADLHKIRGNYIKYANSCDITTNSSDKSQFIFSCNCENHQILFRALGSGCAACTESYNGSTWSAGGAMATARPNLAGAGTNTAALAFGGYSSAAAVACTESYAIGKFIKNITLT